MQDNPTSQNFIDSSFVGHNDIACLNDKDRTPPVCQSDPRPCLSDKAGRSDNTCLNDNASQQYVRPPDLYNSFNPWKTIQSRNRRLSKFAKDSDRERLSHIQDSEIVPVHDSQIEELKMMKEIQQHRHDAIDRTIRVPSQQDIIKSLEKLSHDSRAESAIIDKMHATRQTHQKEFWKPRYLPATVEPTTVYPSTSELVKRSAFGKPNILKSYTVVPTFSHTLLPVLKRDYLTASDLKNLFIAMPAAQFLHQKITDCKYMDFRALRHPNFDWEAKTINSDRQLLREAALIHYDGWYPAIQLYCGWRNTGGQRRTQQILDAVRYVLCEETFTAFAAGFIDGVPNFLHAEVPSEEYLNYKDSAMLPNIKKAPQLVEKQLLKEDSHDLSQLFDARLADFLPNTGIIPIGIATPEDKKPRLYRHCSYKIKESSQPVNVIVNTKETEPEIRFSTTLMNHLRYIWRMRATYPKKHIMPWDDDVSGAFPQLVFHPDTARANCSLLLDRLVLCIALHFGGSFGPANWEPVSWARCELAVFLFKHCTYLQEMNKDVLTLIVIEPPTGRKTTKMTQANSDEYNPPLVKMDGKFDIHYSMYVDDNLSACIYERPLIRQMVAASIEALYLLLGYPGEITKPILPPVAAWDKMVDRPICENRISLGIMIRTYRMVVATPVHKAKRLLHLLDTTWHQKRKSFQVLEAARLLGNLIHLLFTCPWLRCSFYILLDEMREALRKNYLSLLNSPEFKALKQKKELTSSQVAQVNDIVQEVDNPTLQSQAFQDLLNEKDEAWLDPPGKKFAQLSCLNNSIAKRIWRQRRETYIPTLLREQIDWIRLQTQRYIRGETRWERPISHIVQRILDILGLTDASIKRGIGGWCPTLKLWWQISWDEFHPDVRKT